MFPAARQGDPITHDQTTPSGVIGPPVAPGAKGPVLIEGMPAAHVSCSVVCSGATSAGPAHAPPPAPSPPVVSGSASVLVHDMPAARWAPSPDTGACGVFLGDPRQSGTRTVFIGDGGAGLSRAERKVLRALAIAGRTPPPLATPQSDALVDAGSEGVPLVERCPLAPEPSDA